MSIHTNILHHKEDDKFMENMNYNIYDEISGILSTMTPTIVALVGSTKFKDEHDRAVVKLLRTGLYPLPLIYNPYICTDIDKNSLDEHIKTMIDVSNVVHVINPHGYIGKSTANELRYAELKGKNITYEYYPKEKEGLYIITITRDDSKLSSRAYIYAINWRMAIFQVVKLKFGDLTYGLMSDDSAKSYRFGPFVITATRVKEYNFKGGFDL